MGENTKNTEDNVDPKPLDSRVGTPGLFRTYHLHPGDRYELSDGHAIYCAPTSGDNARSIGAGFQVLDSDPDVESAGVDAGYALEDHTMRAPDIAVGGVPDSPGWIKGALPPLAVEYASIGQDEEELQQKIKTLLSKGTQWIWVVRLVGPRRVEVYSKEHGVKRFGPGTVLKAPGVLRNPVPIEALFDRRAAHESTLRNLLQRAGYQSLDDVRAEGKVEGKAEGKAEGLRVACRAMIAHKFGEEVAAQAEGALAKLQDAQLESIMPLILEATSPDGLLESI